MGTEKVLLAEDSNSVATHIQRTLAGAGIDVTIAEDGQVAWEILQAGTEDYEALIIDREMPRMNGMELLDRIKASPRLARIPVVMQTAMDDEESIQEGLARGAYYYLTKPFIPSTLIAVTNAAIAQHRELRAMNEQLRLAEHAMHFLDAGEFSIRTVEEGRTLASWLAQICPEPEKALLGLQELVLNAIEHGNLAISYQEKSRLLQEGCWQEEVARRLDTTEGRKRRVRVQLRRVAGAIHFRIRDEGKGFNWTKYLDFDMERAFDLHGRGIAIARHCSLDVVHYSGNGNTVTATVLLPSMA